MTWHKLLAACGYLVFDGRRRNVFFSPTKDILPLMAPKNFVEENSLRSNTLKNFNFGYKY